ncbi:unnamed protein product [Meganyctiphanes norvegica]|uniref:Uncharacterized protein n=1 Tax=Meganyctiphanes norvegica TaxID=48144 RepID=A0AAV2QRN8_MEGNR
MKSLIAFSCLLALAVGSPQFNVRRNQQQFNQQQTFVSEPINQQRSFGPVVNILRQDSQGEGTPNFSYGFESDDGISVNSRGFQGSAGQANMEGSYSFTLPDGTIAEVRWVADEQGFRAESPLLPVAPVNPHPMPAHALEQIRFAEEQRARGLVWDEFQGRWA